VTLRDALLLGGTDTTVANLDTVFAGTVASGLTGITSSGLANLDGGIAVDTSKFTVDGGGSGNTVVGGTLGVTGISTLTGALTANAGVTVDTLTIDASTITSTGAIILDATTDITLDAGDADIFLKDDSTLFATLTNNSTDLTVAVVGGDISFSDENLVTTGNITGATLFANTKVDAAALEIGNVGGTGEFVVDANGALTMTGANVGVTVVDGSAATTARITSAGLADLTSLEVGNATGGTGELTVAASGNFTNSGTTSLTGALTNTATTSLTGDTSITDARFTITDNNGLNADEVLLDVQMGSGDTVDLGAITLGGATLTADSSGAISLTGSAITATADTSTITLNAATDLGVDAGGDITLDADGADIALKDGGTLFATITNDSSNSTLDITAAQGTIDFGDENLTTTGNITGSTLFANTKVDAAALEVGNVAGTGEFVVDANGALTMTGASVGITVNNGSADTARVTAAGFADLTSLEVGDATGSTGEFTVAANGNLTNSGTSSLTGALTNTATTSLTGDTSITDADFTITDSNGSSTAEVLLKVDADTTATTGDKGTITLGGETLTADSSGAISLTGSAITATADTSTITLNAATDLGVDAGGDITLDADGADIALKDGGTLFATITNDSSNSTLDITAAQGTIDFGDENLTTTGNITGSTLFANTKVDAAALEVGNVAGTGEFVVDANGALTMTGASVGITVNNGSADTARVTAAGFADLTSLEVGDATGGTGEFTVAANGNLTNSGTTSLTGALTNTATTSLTGDTSITDADFTITDSNGSSTAAEVLLVKVDADTTCDDRRYKGAITLGGETLTADSDGAISLTGSAITATADTSTITLNAATRPGC
jgi:fibronectin-binding autotransporter adhesin